MTIITNYISVKLANRELFPLAKCVVTLEGSAVGLIENRTAGFNLSVRPWM